MTPSSSAVPELLTVIEFAARLRVGRSTVFSWIASNKMVLGIHYFKIEKTVRIPWSVELLASLSAVSTVRPVAQIILTCINNIDMLLFSHH